MGQKHKSAIWNRTPLHLHIKPNLHVCRRVQGSQIFKQNWIISIRSRVIEFWCFRLPVALGGERWGVVGVPPTHMHMHVCAHMHTHAHIHVKHDNFNCKWQPQLGESLGIPYDVIHTCACMHVHACTCMCTCVGATLSPPPPPSTQPPGGTPWISQNSIALELIEIFQFCLKIWNLGDFPTHGWVYLLVGGWMGGWVDGWG